MDEYRNQFKGIAAPVTPSILYDIRITHAYKNNIIKHLNISMASFIEKKPVTGPPKATSLKNN